MKKKNSFESAMLRAQELNVSETLKKMLARARYPKRLVNEKNDDRQ